LHRINLLLDHSGLGHPDCFDLFRLRFTDGLNDLRIRFGIDRLGLGLAFCALHSSLCIEF